jgi:adenylate cyclase
MPHDPGNEESAVEPRSGLAHLEIRAALERIVSSREFSGADRACAFLKFVVEETLQGRASQLKGYTIAVEVFGRPPDFDPAHDPVVRIQAGRVRRALDRYYLFSGRDDPIRIEIPRGRYVPVVTSAPTRSEASDAGSIATGIKPGATIAVMPPSDLGENPENAWFSIGLAEEMTAELGRYQHVRTFPLRGVGLPLMSDAERESSVRSTGARFVLGGTIRRDATHLKATAHLVDCTDGHQIWSRSFRITLVASELIESQERIASSVVAAVADELGVVVRKLTSESRGRAPESLSTYEAMLHYHHYMAILEEPAARGALDALEAATNREPDYGPAWSALANLHAHAFLFGRPEIEVSLEEVGRFAERGAALAPMNQLSRTIRAFACLLVGDDDEFANEAEVALELNPHSGYHTGTIGYLLCCHGELDRGYELIRGAIASNPRHPKWFHHGCFFYHFLRGDFEDALRETRAPGSSPGDEALAAIALARMGEVERARDLMEAFVETAPRLAARLPLVLGALVRHPGLAAELSRVTEELIGPTHRD